MVHYGKLDRAGVEEFRVTRLSEASNERNKSIDIQSLVFRGKLVATMGREFSRIARRRKI